MIKIQISFDDLDKLHKDLQQKRERIRFLEVIPSIDSQQADSHICKQENLIQSLQNEIETVKNVQSDYLKFNQNISDENKNLKQLLLTQGEIIKRLTYSNNEINAKLNEQNEKLKVAKNREQAHAKAIDLYKARVICLETNELVDDRNEKIVVLEQEIDRLNAIIKCQNLIGKGTLIGDFKLTSLNSNQSTDSIVLSGGYMVEKLDKIQGLSSSFVTMNDPILDEDRDYDLTSSDDTGW